MPTQWIERDKNEFKRIKDESVPPDMKSRLVARGDLSTVFARSDSPTADKEAIFILFSFASSRNDEYALYHPGASYDDPLEVRANRSYDLGAMVFTPEGGQ